MANLCSFTKESINQFSNLSNDNGKYIFRYLCYSNIDLIKSHSIPPLIKGLDNESVFIEFRPLPHIEFVIRNAIIKLGPSFSHTIICGNLNHDMIQNICSTISPNIKIIKLEANNVSINGYNNLLYNIDFWNALSGKKILIYQEDTLIFKDNIHDFLEYDYIAAPWNLNPIIDHHPNVGNGGFSLRNRQLMIDLLANKSVFDKYFVTNSHYHNSGINLDNIPEDHFFSKCILLSNSGKISPANIALQFASENIPNHDSLGGHQFWNNDIYWMERMDKLFDEYRSV